MPKVFDAKFESTCAECRGIILVGNPIFFPTKSSKDVVHERCGQPIVKPPVVSSTVPPSDQISQTFVCPNCHVSMVLSARVVR